MKYKATITTNKARLAAIAFGALVATAFGLCRVSGVELIGPIIDPIALFGGLALAATASKASLNKPVLPDESVAGNPYDPRSSNYFVIGPGNPLNKPFNLPED